MCAHSKKDCYFYRLKLNHILTVHVRACTVLLDYTAHNTDCVSFSGKEKIGEKDNKKMMTKSCVKNFSIKSYDRK
jgi:hypothetical protein